MAVASFGPGLAYFTVPDNITVVRYRVQGGAGIAVPADELNAGEVQPGGKAAVVEGFLTVTPGEQLWVAAGPAGDRYGVETGVGFGRGGPRGGGAASFLGRGTPVGLPTALVVAGGGGGGGEDGTGGNGGGIGGRGSGNAGVGLGGGQDPSYTSDAGEAATADGTGGGGGGVIGGRAGQLASDRRGGGGGGSSRVPAGASVTSTGTGPGSITLTYGLAPLAPTQLSPAPGAIVAVDRDVDLVWAPNAVAGSGDVQTGAVVTYTTGLGTFTAEVSDATTRVTVPALRLRTGSVSWSVKTRGQGGSESPTSTSTFTAGVAPATPVITAPAAPYTAATPSYDVDWTSTDQAAWRIRRTSSDGSVTFADTGWVIEPGTRRSRQTGTRNGSVEVVRLSTRAANGVESVEATLSVANRWTPPPTPTITLLSDPEHAAIAVQVTRPAPAAGQPVAVRSTYRALVLDGVNAGQLLDVRVQRDPDGVTRWRNPASGVSYVLAVRDEDALGVPAIGLSPAPARGYGHSPYGAAPYGR